jgi:hypothetical protein
MGNDITFTITVNIGILLTKIASNKSCKSPKVTMQLAQKMSVRQLVQKIGIPEEYIGFIVVNGTKSNWDKMIDSDAYVILVPYICGG